jgi:hypothetical protein
MGRLLLFPGVDVKSWSLFALVVAVLMLGAPASAQQDDLKLKAPVTKTLDPKLKEKRARDAVNGYYQALIAGQYDQAGSFAHPDAIEPVRKKLLELIQKAPAAKRASTLKNLGVPDVTYMQSMTTSQFFASYARSTYAANLQGLAKPERKARIKVTKVRCDPSRLLCEVSFDLFQTFEGREGFGSNTVRVADVDGRWLVGEGVGR